MDSGGGVESRRELVRALLLKIGTLQESRGDPVKQQQIVKRMIFKDGFDEKLVQSILQSVAEDTASPLHSDRDGDECLYEMTRLDTVHDYVAGMKEDGVDPADL